VGIVATISVRAVGILEHFGTAYSKIAWYIGVVFFFMFFLNKFSVDAKRAAAVKRSGLSEKIYSGEMLGAKDRELLGSIMCSITTSKDRINYFFIFSTSIITLAAALYLDLKR